MYKLIPLIFLSGCQLYAAAGVHDRAFDSEYNEDKFIGTLGFSQELNDNFELYIEHSSMPLINELRKTDNKGHGVNQAGIKAKIKLF